MKKVSHIVSLGEEVTIFRFQNMNAQEGGSQAKLFQGEFGTSEHG